MNKTRVDSERDYILEEQAGHLLRKVNQRHTLIFSSIMKELELTPMQFAVMVKIGEHDEISQNQLGRQVAMDPATVQGVVKRLAQRGLIVARPDHADRRRHLWTLSETGAGLLKQAIPRAKQITRATLAPLSETESKNLSGILKKLL